MRKWSGTWVWSQLCPKWTVSADQDSPELRALCTCPMQDPKNTQYKHLVLCLMVLMSSGFLPGWELP
jgi:hypothetical protein